MGMLLPGSIVLYVAQLRHLYDMTHLFLGFIYHPLLCSSSLVYPPLQVTISSTPYSSLPLTQRTH